MYKVYKYSSGKLIPHFEVKPFDSIESAEKMIRWFFESRRTPQDIQMVIATDEEIVKTVKSSDV